MSKIQLIILELELSDAFLNISTFHVICNTSA